MVRLSARFAGTCRSFVFRNAEFAAVAFQPCKVATGFRTVTTVLTAEKELTAAAFALAKRAVSEAPPLFKLARFRAELTVGLALERQYAVALLAEYGDAIE
jgi:hypothetical protein